MKCSHMLKFGLKNVNHSFFSDFICIFVLQFRIEGKDETLEYSFLCSLYGNVKIIKFL